MNVNLGHRQRVKEKFKSTKLNSFHDHEALEMLLFYCIPRKDTNKTSHKILEEFKTLYNLFSSTYDELIASPYITEHMSILILLVNKIDTIYKNESKKQKKIITRDDEYNDLAIDELEDEDEPSCVIICLNIEKKLMKYGKIKLENEDEGSIIKKILELVLIYDALEIIVVYKNLTKMNTRFYKGVASDKLKTSLQFCDISLKERIYIEKKKKISRVIENISNEYPRKNFKESFKKKEDKELRKEDILDVLISYGQKGDKSNILAYRILKEVGSFDRIFTCSIKELRSMCNISEHLSVLIVLIFELIKKQELCKLTNDYVVDSTKSAGELVMKILKGYRGEHFLTVCLDKNNKLLHYEISSIGTINEITVYIRTIMDIAISNKSKSVIIAHNHPSGNLKPSLADIKTTNDVKYSLQLAGIVFLDHIIVSDSGYYSFVEE